MIHGATLQSSVCVKCYTSGYSHTYSFFIQGNSVSIVVLRLVLLKVHIFGMDAMLIGEQLPVL